jgi:deazaflavin-dependent oxidoreductase (nitroreductase family)
VAQVSFLLKRKRSAQRFEYAAAGSNLQGLICSMDNDPKYLYLTTTGRKTGEPREIEIWFTHLNRSYYLIAEHRERANWVQNILHDPRVSFRVGKQKFNGAGRVVDETKEEDLWRSIRALSDEKYGWSDGLVVELTPIIATHHYPH